jgi:pimeloyl-ACP methyl ester carboxylesterase
MPALADRWRTVAPDCPGFGYTEVPSGFACTFDGYAGFLRSFAATLGLDRYVLYLQDYGSQFGLRLAMSAPERVAGLVVQNGDIYADQHGPKCEPLKKLWAAAPGPDGYLGNVTEDGFRDEFVCEIPDHLAELVSPDLWRLSWAQVGGIDGASRSCSPTSPRPWTGSRPSRPICAERCRRDACGATAALRLP